MFQFTSEQLYIFEVSVWETMNVLVNMNFELEKS